MENIDEGFSFPETFSMINFRDKTGPVEKKIALAYLRSRTADNFDNFRCTRVHPAVLERAAGTTGF